MPEHPGPALDPETTVLRSRATGSALAAYTAAYGHPLEHPAGGGHGERRWAASRRVVAAVSVVLVLLTGAVVMSSLGGRATVIPLASGEAEGPEPVTDGAAMPGAHGAGAPGTGAPGTTGAAPEPPPGVVVHVVGQVRRPGLVELEAGARVSDAIEAAGGPTSRAELSALNLARPVTDGEQVVVPAPGEPVAPVDGAGDSVASGGTLDLNSADAQALDGLPGIGPVLAERIVAWRDEHGRFTAVDELTEVSGIGPAVLESIRDLVRV